MAEEQKNSSAETVDAAASAAHTVKGAIKAGKAISGAAKGAAAGGPYGAVAGAVWAGRKHIGKIIAIIAILLLLPVLFLLMLPGLIFGGLVNAFSPADPDTPILNSETAIVENANDITFAINAILGEALDDVMARIEVDFASSGADKMEVKNPYSSGLVYNANLIVSQYARSLLHFRGLWDAAHPRVADIEKVRRKIRSLPSGSIIRLGGMTDCFQPCELHYRTTYQTIQEMNLCRVSYLIVTKSALPAAPEYLEILDKELAHIQITVTCLDDTQTAQFEKASPPSQRIRAIQALQAEGYDVAIRLSPIVEEYMDFDKLNDLGIERCVVEFLRVNSWIRQWFRGVDFSKYTVRQGGYYHLPLKEKQRIVEKIHIPQKTICEDVTEHYQFWRDFVNPNKEDCCNLRKTHH